MTAAGQSTGEPLAVLKPQTLAGADGIELPTAGV
jgi:hypothetical protein